jgi:hypothetical protein
MMNDRKTEKSVFKMWPINEEYRVTTLEMPLRVNHRKGIKKHLGDLFPYIEPNRRQLYITKGVSIEVRVRPVSVRSWPFFQPLTEISTGIFLGSRAR